MARLTKEFQSLCWKHEQFDVEKSLQWPHSSITFFAHASSHVRGRPVLCSVVFRHLLGTANILGALWCPRFFCLDFAYLLFMKLFHNLEPSKLECCWRAHSGRDGAERQVFECQCHSGLYSANFCTLWLININLTIARVGQPRATCKHLVFSS